MAGLLVVSPGGEEARFFNIPDDFPFY